MSVYPRAETAKAAGQAASGVPDKPSFPQLEEGVLAYWAAQDTFRKSVGQRPVDSPADPASGDSELPG
jgi:isoleucyl-tRNA synthetase